MTLSPSGAQAGEMPKDGELLEAAAKEQLAEVRRLIKNHANIEEQNHVSDGAGTSIAAGV